MKNGADILRVYERQGRACMNLLIVDDDIPTTQAVRDCVLKMELPIGEIEMAYNVVTAKALLEQG